MKAFALLEFLIFIAVLSVIIVAFLGSWTLTQPLHQTKLTDNVAICNNIASDCVLDSKIPTLAPFLEINATKVP